MHWSLLLVIGSATDLTRRQVSDEDAGRDSLTGLLRAEDRLEVSADGALSSPFGPEAVFALEAEHRPQSQQALLETDLEAQEDAAQGAGLGVNKEQLKLWIKCSDLPSQLGDKIDPYLKLYEKVGGDKIWKVKSSKHENNPNPVFDPLIVPFDFTRVQRVTVGLMDEDSVTDDDKIGFFEINLGEIFFKMRDFEPQSFELTAKRDGSGQILQSHGKPSKCTVYKALVPVDEVMFLAFNGVKLAAKDHSAFRSSSSDPYLKLFRPGASEPLLTTNTISRNLNPVWDDAQLKVEELGNGDWGQNLRAEVWDSDFATSDDLIGECDFEAKHLMVPPSGGKICDLLKAGKDGSQGELGLTTSKGIKPMQIGDYLQAGVELDFTIAVDFTASNINQGLHADGRDSPYGIAIEQIGSVIEQYDSDKQYSMFLFGALLDRGNPSTEPPIEGLPGFVNSIEVTTQEPHNTQALLDAYDMMVRWCDTILVPNGRGSAHQGCYYGPTNYHNVIEATVQDLRRTTASKAARGKNIYKVLVVVTDGTPHDEQETMQELIKAAQLPISVIFVAVGSADFSALQRFDGDGGDFSNWPRAAGASRRGPPRDVVQFVDFPEGDRNALSRETLKEIPNQMVDAFLGQGIPRVSHVEIDNIMYEFPLEVHGKDQYTGTTTYVERRQSVGMSRS